MMNRIIKTGLLLTALMACGVFGLRAQITCKCVLPIDSTFKVAPMTLGQGTDVGVPPLYENNNACTPAMALPFNFCFYGHNYDSVFISNNGIISFIKPIFSFIDSPATVPLGADTLIIAPFWADASTLNNNGVVYYKITSTYMAVIWDSVRYAGVDVDGWNTFQLIITDGNDPIITSGNNVAFCYPIMQWACSDSSGGFSGYGGTPAFVGINKGDKFHYAQLGTFALPGEAYYGPFAADNGVDWLNFESFTLNTCVSNNVIAPVIFNDRPACNTLYICPCDTILPEISHQDHDTVYACDTVNLTAAFICAMPGQTQTLSYACNSSLNINNVSTSGSNGIDSITVQIIPVFPDTGTHIVTLTATDTINHVQSTVTYKIIVTVDCLNPPPPPPNGIIEVASADYFSVYPNPANRNITIQLNNVTGVATTKIYDVLGNNVLSPVLRGNKSDVDISQLAMGIYFVKLFENGVQLQAQKFLIQ